NLEAAIPVFQQALKFKETIPAHRKLAYAYFNRAQQVKDELMPQFDPVREQIKSAYRGAFITVRTMRGTYQRFNPNDAGYLAAVQSYKDLIKRADVAFDFYDKARSEFGAVVRLAPNKKDLDA